MTTVGLIWAQSTSGVVGRRGGIPWRLPEDQARFKELTMGRTVVMGRLTWESLPAKVRPLPQALRIAVPRASHAITTAGLILAATFALVAIIPLSTFRQIAFAMTVGLLLDTFIIRPVLTPAILTLLGPAASWPSKRVRRSEPQAPETSLSGDLIHG